MLVAKRAQPPQRFSVVKAHAAGALYQRFGDDGGHLMRMGGEKGVERRGLFGVGRQFGDQLFGDRTLEQRVHALIRVADRHGGQRVAVIAALEGNEARPAASAVVDPVLHGDLHRDLDRNRTGFGKEHMAEIAGQQRR